MAPLYQEFGSAYADIIAEIQEIGKAYR